MRNVWHAASGHLRVLYLLTALGVIADAVLVVLQMQAGNYLSVAALWC
jgi:ABC-type nickel/cobalt efflux system permease component RcnA